MLNSDQIRAELASLKENLVCVEKSLLPSKKRFFETDKLSGRRVLRTVLEPAPSRKHPWTIAQEAKRFDLIAKIKALSKSLPSRPALRAVVQERSRPAHPSFGKRACRRKLKGVRITLSGGRRSVPADRLDLSKLWVKEANLEVLEPALRLALPEDLIEKDQINARSVLRHRRQDPKHPKPRRKPPRKAFFKMFRNFKP
ncbi:MAG: hypothetical protein ACRD2L_10175 [Terriglobia bacterium]